MSIGDVWVRKYQSGKWQSGMCLAGETPFGEMFVGDVFGRGNVRWGSDRRGNARRGCVRESMTQMHLFPKTHSLNLGESADEILHHLKLKNVSRIYRPNGNANSNGIALYVREDILSKQILFQSDAKDIE